MAGRIAYLGNIVTQGLVLDLDAAKRESYPGTGSTWFDINNTGNNGTLISGSVYTDSNYGSISFNGTDGTVSFPSSFNATTAGLNSYHTVEMWVNPARINQPNDGLFRCINTGTVNGYLHYLIRNSYFYLGWYGIDVPGSRLLTLNTWYQAVFMFDTDNKQKIYVNGVLDAAGPALTSSFNGGTAGIQLGVYATFYTGSMPVCRVYNRALTATEVLQNFNAYRSRYGI